MQASWGQENGAPTPLRGGLLFGESGTWKVNDRCSVPDVFTYADKEVRGADDPDVKFKQRGYYKTKNDQAGVQQLSTKKPAEQDINAQGMSALMHSHMKPGKMTMADHDKGLIWPPPMDGGGQQVSFMAMVKDDIPRVGQVNGIMVGYKGHVPRARDKIGGSPLGGLPAARGEAGFPLPEETAATALPAMGAQTSMPGAENSLYISAQREVQFRTAAAAAGMHNTSPSKIHTTSKQNGYIPRYAGHKPTAYTKGVGGSVYGFKHKDKKKVDYTYMMQGNELDGFGGEDYLEPEVINACQDFTTTGTKLAT